MMRVSDQESCACLLVKSASVSSNRSSGRVAFKCDKSLCQVGMCSLERLVPVGLVVRVSKGAVMSNLYLRDRSMCAQVGNEAAHRSALATVVSMQRCLFTLQLAEREREVKWSGAGACHCSQPLSARLVCTNESSCVRARGERGDLPSRGALSHRNLYILIFLGPKPVKLTIPWLALVWCVICV